MDGRECRRRCPVPVPSDHPDKAKVLDAFFVPTRCPNGQPEGAPFEHLARVLRTETVWVFDRGDEPPRPA